MSFPIRRPRRLRSSEIIRRMVRENQVNLSDLIYPMFVCEGQGVKTEVSSMPGVYNLSIDNFVKELAQVVELGVPGVILFGIPAEKDSVGSGAYAEDGIVQKAVKAAKTAFPNLYVITDVCLCEYTDHGHCGIVKDGDVLNDPTLDLLAKTALSHAQAGADMVAPSDMMDGRIGAIREVLDEAGLSGVPIMAYSAKYASAFYGPFRDAAGSTPQFGDRRSYQMDPANGHEALSETALDIDEGADIVMVKPGLAYMDIIRRLKEEFSLPTAVYNVSGEYAMVKAAAANGWVDEKRIVMEIMHGFKRAGADLILTYHALDVARWLKEGK